MTIVGRASTCILFHRIREILPLLAPDLRYSCPRSLDYWSHTLHAAPRSNAIIMSGVDTADSTTNALSNDARPAFVTPRDLLQQSRAPLPPKEQPRQLSAVDREQLDGLVRDPVSRMVAAPADKS
jgi:hypothetical protein